MMLAEMKITAAENRRPVGSRMSGKFRWVEEIDRRFHWIRMVLFR